MSWLVLGALLLLATVFVLAPILTTAHTVQDDELSKIKGHIKALTYDNDGELVTGTSSEASVRELEERALEILDKSEAKNSLLPRSLVVLTSVVLAVAAVVLYANLGTPNFDDLRVAPTDIETMTADELPLEVLVERLQQRLATDPAPPAIGYQLLGRSLMGIGRFEQAIISYEKALEISDGDPDIQAEYDRALTFIRSQNRPEISPEIIESFQKMPMQQREQAIAAMVDSLASRLAEDPADISGWQRLLRSRRVLGQNDLAQRELAAGLEALSDNPALRSQLETLAEKLGFAVK